MKRTIDQWRKCSPLKMAHEQSDVAKRFAFEDAKADILELYAENMRLRNIARVIAYPAHGTPETAYSMRDLALLLQSAYTAEQLWVNPEDR